MGSRGFHDVSAETLESYKKENQWNCLERQTIDGDSPVRKILFLLESSQVPRDTSNPVGIREDHLPRLNTTQ